MNKIAELASILKTNEKNAPTRAVKMRLSPACSRCLGSGQYSFNGTHSTCYRCSGGGADPVTLKNIDSVIDNARAAAEDGRLEGYVEAIRAAAEVKKNHELIFSAWKASVANKGCPHHCKRDEECAPHELACRQANFRIAEAYKAYSALQNKKGHEIEKRDALRRFFETIEATNKELAGE